MYYLISMGGNLISNSALQKDIPVITATVSGEMEILRTDMGWVT